MRPRQKLFISWIIKDSLISNTKTKLAFPKENYVPLASQKPSALPFHMMMVPLKKYEFAREDYRARYFFWNKNKTKYFRLRLAGNNALMLPRILLKTASSGGPCIPLAASGGCISALDLELRKVQFSVTLETFESPTLVCTLSLRASLTSNLRISRSS